MKKKPLIIAIVIIIVLAAALYFGVLSKKTIGLEIVQKDGSVHTYSFKTKTDNLEDLLLETGLVEGDMGQYGLYIKKVQGVEADYDKDQSYWAMKKNGEDLMTGARDTKLTSGDKYSLVYTK